MTRLYHGSNISIEKIDLTRSKRGKDFGKGFYLNANAEQAMAMAVRNARFMNEGGDQLYRVLNLMKPRPTNWGLILKFSVITRKNGSNLSWPTARTTPTRLYIHTTLL